MNFVMEGLNCRELLSSRETFTDQIINDCLRPRFSIAPFFIWRKPQSRRSISKIAFRFDLAFLLLFSKFYCGEVQSRADLQQTEQQGNNRKPLCGETMLLCS